MSVAKSSVVSQIAVVSSGAPLAGQYRRGRVVKAGRKGGQASYVLVNIGPSEQESIVGIILAHKLGAKKEDELARFEEIERAVSAGQAVEITVLLSSIGTQPGTDKPSYLLDERSYIWAKAEDDIAALVGTNVMANVVGVVSGDHGPYGVRLQVTDFFTGLLHVSETCNEKIAAAYMGKGDDVWDGRDARFARSSRMKELADRFAAEGSFPLIVEVLPVEKRPARDQRPDQPQRMQLLVSASEAAVHYKAKQTGTPVSFVAGDIHALPTPVAMVAGTTAHQLDQRPPVSEVAAVAQVVASQPAAPAVVNDTLAATSPALDLGSVVVAPVVNIDERGAQAACSLPAAIPAAVASVPTVSGDEEKAARIRAAIAQLEVAGRTYKGPIRRLLENHVEVHIGNGVPVLLNRSQLPNRGKYQWKNGDKIEGLRVLSVNTETLEVVVERVEAKS